MSDWFSKGTFDSIRGLSSKDIASGQKNTGGSSDGNTYVPTIPGNQGDSPGGGKAGAGEYTANQTTQRDDRRSAGGYNPSSKSSSPIAQASQTVSQVGALMASIGGIREQASKMFAEKRANDEREAFRALNTISSVGNTTSGARNRSENRPIQGKSTTIKSSTGGYNPVGPGDNARSWEKPSTPLTKPKDSAVNYGQHFSTRKTDYSPGKKGERPDYSKLSTGQDYFMEVLAPMIYQRAVETGVNPQLAVAQAAHESNYGTHTAGSYMGNRNMFGVKYVGAPTQQWGSKTVPTRDQDGEYMGTFANMPTYEDSINDYLRVIQLPHYADAVTATSLEAAIAAIGASPYAKYNPEYADRLTATANQAGLWDYKPTVTMEDWPTQVNYPVNANLVPVKGY